MTFNRLAPNITGMAKKKENSLATVLEQPQYKPPKIVAPDLDVPGIKAKPICNPNAQWFEPFLSLDVFLRK